MGTSKPCAIHGQRASHGQQECSMQPQWGAHLPCACPWLCPAASFWPMSVCPGTVLLPQVCDGERCGR